MTPAAATSSLPPAGKPPMAPALTPKQAARLLGVHPDHLYDLTEAGALRAVDVAKGFPLGKRCLRYPLDGLQAFLRARDTLKGAAPKVTARALKPRRKK